MSGGAPRGEPGMTTRIDGACHCGNLRYELETEQSEQDIRARACDCSFCRIHGAKNWSDSQGAATIRVADEDALQRYRFALRTADFYVCKVCGAYAGAVLTEGSSSWSTVNLRLSRLHAIDEEPASYGAEQEADRVERRRRVWTPTKIVVAK